MSGVQNLKNIFLAHTSNLRILMSDNYRVNATIVSCVSIQTEYYVPQARGVRPQKPSRQKEKCQQIPRRTTLFSINKLVFNFTNFLIMISTIKSQILKVLPLVALILCITPIKGKQNCYFLYKFIENTKCCY